MRQSLNTILNVLSRFNVFHHLYITQKLVFVMSLALLSFGAIGVSFFYLQTTLNLQRNYLEQFWATNDERPISAPASETALQDFMRASEAAAIQHQIILIVAGGLVIVSLGGLAWGLSCSIRRLAKGTAKVAAGDLEARMQLNTHDELGQLGRAFDQMLDDRAQSITKSEQESEQLNKSVARLLEAAAQLSAYDLTVRMPLSEDVTGNIAEALNLMTSETARVLFNINNLARQLDTTAQAMRDQGGRVADVASNEREVVTQALARIEDSTAMSNEIAALITNCNTLADDAEKFTKSALAAVRKTMQSMNGIRQGVSETENGIKRLGDRSQEIGGIVAIIKGIAGRTHALALNAGMQAVAAGEAGRSFSVVVDEVQRLAETSRESSAQIAALVKNIQAEASETMATMNKTIDLVMEGSELAEAAGKRMRRTQTSTDELVTAVEQIADRSQSQMALNNELYRQAIGLRENTTATEQELSEQTTQAEHLFTYLDELVQSVSIFKLPDDAGSLDELHAQSTLTLVSNDG